MDFKPAFVSKTSRNWLWMALSICLRNPFLEKAGEYMAGEDFKKFH